MTRVAEVFTTSSDHPGTPQQVIEKLVALGWEVEEQHEGYTVLKHQLVPGASRIVST